MDTKSEGNVAQTESRSVPDTKAKPATRAELERSLISVVYPDTQRAAEKDLASIVQLAKCEAISAYPKLVAALKMAASARLDVRHDARENARNVLRELGEL